MAFLTDEEKQSLLDRYFDIEWRDDVSDLRCVRCHRVAISHFVSSCQHLFCKICSKFYSDEELQWNCPRCQEHISQPNYQDFNVEVKIHQLKIRCPNKKYGCKHADEMRKMPYHLTTCVDTRAAAALPVEYMKGIDNIIANKVEEKFIKLERKTEDMGGKFNSLTESVTSVVKKVQGVELASKKTTEELQSIKSLLESINQRIQKNESLIHQTSSNVEEMKLTQNSKVLNSLKAETYEWTIKGVEKTILKDNWRYESDVFNFIGYNCDIKAKLEKKEGKTAICLQFKDGSMINQLGKKCEFTKIKYIIRAQENTQKKEDVIFEADLKFYDCYARPSWIFVQGLASAMLSPPYTKDDCFKITMVFEPSSIDRSFVSNNGVLLWRVDNYRTKKQEQFYYDILSPTFYTSPQGYRVRIGLLINYSKPMEIEVIFLTGEHDNSLPINSPHKTTVTLFNQTDPSKNVVRSEQRKDVNFYSMQLESVKLIEENGFVKDDSILLKVVIEPQEHKNRLI